jgi:hypothetical protein
MDKKPQAKTTRMSEGSQGSVTAPDTMEGPGQIDSMEAFDNQDQFLHSTLSTMAQQEFIQNYASCQGEGSNNYSVKISKVGNLHVIMTKIVRNYFSSGGNSSDMKLLLSTILMTLSTALHGLLNPDFISRLESKDRMFFLCQHGFRYRVGPGKAAQQTQIAKFINRVIHSTKATNYKIPDEIK